MKIFLTGGTGFIGLPLTRQLLEQGWQVTALVRNPESARARLIAGMGATLVKGDVTDRESMRQGMSGADIVIHNAGWYELGVKHDAASRMWRINVGGTENVFNLARELGIERIVYVSSVAAYGETGSTLRDETFLGQIPARTTAYTQSKIGAHWAAVEHQKQGLPLVIVCPSLVIGANDHSIWGYFSRLYVNYILPPLAMAKDAIQNHVWVEDIAEGIILAAEKGRLGEVYFLSGESLKIQEILDGIWSKTPGAAKFRLYLSVRGAYYFFATFEPFERLIGVPAFISRETAEASGVNYNFSNQKARRELGWNPKPIREAWLETLAAERELRGKRKKRGLAALLNPLNE